MFEIVVSTENNPYMVWQAMLFHASCMRHVGQAPIVMVHQHAGEFRKRQLFVQSFRTQSERIDVDQRSLFVIVPPAAFLNGLPQ